MDENTPAVQLNGLAKRYGSLVAVDDLSLTIQRGSVVALLGPNGAGKSTTTEMMTGLTRPDAGSAQVFGLDPVSAVAADLVGVMLQNGALLPEVRVGRMLTMAHGLHAHPRSLDEVIARAGVADVLRTPCGKLSGGQAQRVRFALALMGHSELMLLDEPTVGMDVATRRGFWRDMRHYADEGKSIVFATHYLEEADEFADRVVLMAHGRVVADGSGAQIKDSIGARTVSFAVSQDAAALRSAEADCLWAGLPGVTRVMTSGGRVELSTTDSDATARAVLALDGPHNLQISGVSLEDAFVQLTDEKTQLEGNR